MAQLTIDSVLLFTWCYDQLDSIARALKEEISGWIDENKSQHSNPELKSRI